MADRILRTCRIRYKRTIGAVLALAVLIVSVYVVLIATAESEDACWHEHTPDCYAAQAGHNCADYKRCVPIFSEAIAGHAHTGDCYMIVHSPACGLDEDDAAFGAGMDDGPVISSLLYVHSDVCCKTTVTLVCNTKEGAGASDGGEIIDYTCDANELICEHAHCVNGNPCNEVLSKAKYPRT